MKTSGRPVSRLCMFVVAAVLTSVCASSAAEHAASHHAYAAGAQDAGSPTADPAEAAYLDQNAAAMSKMMDGMAVKPTGDVDRDFVAMMVPHHQGAIDMARAVLRYGHNEQIRRIAQEIVVDQLQEITAMRLAVGEPLPPSTASPTQPNVPAPDLDAGSHGATSGSPQSTKMH